jgi:hypothetical protein
VRERTGKRLRPHSEWQIGLLLEAPADDAVKAAPLGARQQLVGEAGLANTGLAREHDHTAVRGRGRIQRRLQSRELRLTANEARLLQRQDGSDAAVHRAVF